jgi:hypothetical protein
MSDKSINVFLLVQDKSFDTAAEGFNRIQNNLVALRYRQISDGVYLIFSGKDHRQLTKQLFEGVAPGAKDILALISNTASTPG